MKTSIGVSVDATPRAPGRGKRWGRSGTARHSSHPHPGRRPSRLQAPGFQSGRQAGRRDGEGLAGLPLVGGGLPGRAQPCAPHRLVPERAVLVDAAHSPQAAGPGPGTPQGDAQGRRASAGTGNPATDPGRARWPRSSWAGLKGTEPCSGPQDPWREGASGKTLGWGFSTSNACSPSSYYRTETPAPTYAQRRNCGPEIL